MKFDIKVTCDTAEEAAIIVAKLAEAEKIFKDESRETANESAPVKPTVESVADDDVKTATEETAEPKKKSARKSKMEKVAETLGATDKADEPLDPAPASAAANTAVLTLDDARAALQKVMDKFGMPGATAFISAQGYKRVTEIPASDYQKFIDAANAKIAA